MIVTETDYKTLLNHSLRTQLTFPMPQVVSLKMMFEELVQKIIP